MLKIKGNIKEFLTNLFFIFLASTDSGEFKDFLSFLYPLTCKMGKINKIQQFSSIFNTANAFICG